MRLIAVLASLCLLASCAERAAPVPDTDWAVLGNSAEMQHHSALAAINQGNVASLGLAWWVEMPTVSGLVGNPLVQDGVVFQGGPGGQMFANDARTGKLLWQFKAEPKLDGTTYAAYISHQFNRGLALSGDKAIIATGDCRLIAVSQKTGKVAWEATSCDAKDFYGITAAPRVGGGLVFTGNNCMDSGQSRGYVEAFDADTGTRKWRFYTSPGDPSRPPEDAVQEMAAKTWGKGWYGKSKGCASVWEGITYDPVLKQVYIGTGGPAPWQPSRRGEGAGDELFTNSIVALDAATGAYRWHFKEVPQDGWNFDSTVGIMVADLQVGDAARRTVISVPKNGFAYVLDARTGKFLAGKNYVDVNWTKGLDAEGRPIRNPEAEYWNLPGGSFVVLPSTMGSHGWEALALDPASGTLYIPTMVIPTRIGNSPSEANTGIIMDFYAGDEPGAAQRARGELVAWDPVAGREKWRVPARMPINGGLMHTAGGLVFQGMADGRLVAFDAKTGRELWSRQTGGAIRAAPSTVMLGGEQYVIVATGNGSSSATGSYVSRYNSTPESRTPPRLLAFKLGGTASVPPLAVPARIAKPIAPRQDPKLAAVGESMFEGYTCAACHGAHGASVGGRVPNLNRAPPPDYAMFRQVVVGGALAANGMPGFKDMPEADAKALFAYIINEAWEAHEKDAAAAH